MTEEPAAARATALGGLLRRPLVWVVGALVVAGIVAVVVLAAGGSDSSSSSSESPSLEPGRAASLAVYDAWRNDRLEALDAGQISAGARRALAQMPTAPILPVPPDECSGSPEKVGCPYGYPGAGLFLDFTVLEYPTGPRVTEITCHDGGTGDAIAGGIAACARIVSES